MANTCPLCLEDLNRPTVCEKSAGGMVTEFLYGLKEDVQSFPQKKNFALRQSLSDHIETVTGSDLVMKTGKRMFRLQVKKSSAELKYTLQGESGSRSFKATLECFSPVVRATLLGFLAATANQEIIILAKTRTGEWHLLGDEDEGVEYDSAEAATGKAGSDANGTSITFSTECAAPTIYMGDISNLTNNSSYTPAVLRDVQDFTYNPQEAMLSATVDFNDDNVSDAGFRYRKEDDNQWIDIHYGVPTSGQPFTHTEQNLDSGDDYFYYAYIVVGNTEYRSDTFAFRPQ